MPSRHMHVDKKSHNITMLVLKNNFEVVSINTLLVAHTDNITVYVTVVQHDASNLLDVLMSGCLSIQNPLGFLLCKYIFLQLLYFCWEGTESDCSYRHILFLM